MSYAGAARCAVARHCRHLRRHPARQWANATPHERPTFGAPLTTVSSATTVAKPVTPTAAASTARYTCVALPSTRHVQSEVNGHGTSATISPHLSGDLGGRRVRHHKDATSHRYVRSTAALSGAVPRAHILKTKGSNRWRSGCCTTKYRKSSADDDDATMKSSEHAASRGRGALTRKLRGRKT